MTRIKTFSIALAAVLIIIVIAQNTQEVQTHVLWMRVTMPRAVLLIVTLVLGFGLGTLFGGRLRRKP